MKKFPLILLILSVLILGTSFTTAYANASSSKSQFKSYKVVITANKLSIRNTPSNKGKIVGYYYKNNTVDIIGVSGGYLKTNKGYIWSGYTKKIAAPVINKKPEETKPVVEKIYKYITVKSDAPLLKDTNGTEDERYLVNGIKYKVIGEDSKYYKVRIGSETGYVDKANVEALTEGKDDNITITWHNISSKYNNKYAYDEEADYARRSSCETGFDVLSPTWFYMAGDENAPVVDEKGDREYVKTAHKNGYEVWGMFHESNGKRAEAIFNNSKLSDEIINKIVDYSVEYNLDGINIDFESLGNSRKNGYTEFVKNLSRKLKEKGIIVSIDVAKPYSWNEWQNIGVTKDYADYIIFMGYNEHDLKSEIPGSNASYNWVKDGIDQILKQGVDGSKLILGVPFYTWEYAVFDVVKPEYDTVICTVKDTSLYSNMDKNDLNIIKKCSYDERFKYKGIDESKELYIVEYTGVSAYIPINNSAVVKGNSTKTFVAGSWSRGMDDMINSIKDNNALVKFDEATKQDISEYINKDNGLKYISWLENEKSMSWRMDLVKNYKLKGAAGWDLYWRPNKDVVKVIKDRLK